MDCDRPARMPDGLVRLPSTPWTDCGHSGWGMVWWSCGYHGAGRGREGGGLRICIGNSLRHTCHPHTRLHWQVRECQNRRPIRDHCPLPSTRLFRMVGPSATSNKQQGLEHRWDEDATIEAPLNNGIVGSNPLRTLEGLQRVHLRMYSRCG